MVVVAAATFVTCCFMDSSLSRWRPRSCDQPAPLWHCVTLALFINVLIIIIIIIIIIRSRTTVDGCTARQSYSKWAVQAVQAGQICPRPQPDSLSFVGIQLQAPWFAPSADIVCAAWETHAQRVGVARLTTIMELSVVGVEVWPYGMSIQQWNNVFSVRHKRTWTQDRALRYTAVDWKNCASVVLRKWMTESDRLNMTRSNQLRVVDSMENSLDRIVRSIWWSTVSNAALRSSKTRIKRHFTTVNRTNEVVMNWQKGCMSRLNRRTDTLTVELAESWMLLDVHGTGRQRHVQ